MSKGIINLYESDKSSIDLTEYKEDELEDKKFWSYNECKTDNDVNCENSDNIPRIRKRAKRTSSDGSPR